MWTENGYSNNILLLYIYLYITNNIHERLLSDGKWIEVAN